MACSLANYSVMNRDKSTAKYSLFCIKINMLQFTDGHFQVTSPQGGLWLIMFSRFRLRCPVQGRAGQQTPRRQTGCLPRMSENIIRQGTVSCRQTAAAGGVGC